MRLTWTCIVLCMYTTRVRYLLQLSYSLKVKIGDVGDIINAHCECPSGIGPHGTCKHVAALLLGICKMRDSGSSLGINEGCTDRLQSFHQPSKKYGGKIILEQCLCKPHSKLYIVSSSAYFPTFMWGRCVL